MPTSGCRIPAEGASSSGVHRFVAIAFTILGNEAYADAIAAYYQIRLRPILSGYCTWYSNPYGGAGDEVHIVTACSGSLGFRRGPPDLSAGSRFFRNSRVSSCP